jgi:uncharacterized protein YjbI with pentapeptide repeats
VLVGAGFAYLQFSQQQRQFSQQQQASHELLISNQVSKGFEQLGSHEVIVQLGGIYALEGVMNASEQYHQPVLEALCAFVRDKTKTEVKGDQPPATEVQAALTVIGRRRSSRLDLVDLSYAKIPSVDLPHANLFHANLYFADLKGAHLINADLRATDLRGTDLAGADLSDADLSHAELLGTRLRSADPERRQPERRRSVRRRPARRRPIRRQPETRRPA